LIYIDQARTHVSSKKHETRAKSDARARGSEVWEIGTTACCLSTVACKSTASALRYCRSPPFPRHNPHDYKDLNHALVTAVHETAQVLRSNLAEVHPGNCSLPTLPPLSRCCSHGIPFQRVSDSSVALGFGIDLFSRLHQSLMLPIVFVPSYEMGMTMRGICAVLRPLVRVIISWQGICIQPLHGDLGELSRRRRQSHSSVTLSD
jgi:hypothetical protein